MASSAASVDSSFGAKPPSSPTAVERPLSFSTFFSAWNTSQPMRRPSANVLGADRHDHEFLEVDRGVRVRAAVHDVHHRHGQHLGVRAADVLVEGLVQRGGGGLGGREGDAEDGVGAELRLGLRAVELDHRPVDADLVARVEPDEGRGDLRLHVGRRPSGRPCRRSASCRRRAARSPRARRCEAPEGTAARPRAPRGEADVDLDGRIAAGIDDLAGGDGGDGGVHGRCW